MQDKAASGVPAAAEAAGPAVSGPYAPLMKAVEQGLAQIRPVKTGRTSHGRIT